METSIRAIPPRPTTSHPGTRLSVWSTLWTPRHIAAALLIQRWYRGIKLAHVVSRASIRTLLAQKRQALRLPPSPHPRLISAGQQTRQTRKEKENLGVAIADSVKRSGIVDSTQLRTQEQPVNLQEHARQPLEHSILTVTTERSTPDPLISSYPRDGKIPAGNTLEAEGARSIVSYPGLMRASIPRMEILPRSADTQVCLSGNIVVAERLVTS